MRGELEPQSFHLGGDPEKTVLHSAVPSHGLYRNTSLVMADSLATEFG